MKISTIISIYSKLFFLLRKHSNKKTIIIVFGNYQFKEVLDNWLVAMQRINIKNYIIIAYDKKLYDYLIDRNIPSFFFESGTSLGELWVKRVALIKIILNIGYNVIHSDADAIWLKNPITDYLNFNSFDIVFSQGTVCPYDIHEKNGFVLCCGLFGIKSNKITRKLMKEVYDDVQETMHDQTSFNHVIDRKNTIWEINDKYKLSYKNYLFSCSHQIIKGWNPLFSIALLPHSLFQRVTELNKDAYVKHLISEIRNENRIEILKNNNIYFLDNKNN